MRKLFVLAASAAILLASCAKEGNQNNGNNGNNGEANAAQVSFSFTLPSSAATRADTQISTNDEIKVNRVSVFVFDATGAPASLNHYTDFDATEVANAFTTSNNTVAQKVEYTLKEEYYIETISGKAHIYVGINLPASLDHAYTSEAALRAAKSNANGEGLKNQTPATLDGEGFATSQDFTMFGQAFNSSNGTDVDLAEYVEGQETTVTPVTVDVERVVSKVVGTVADKNTPFNATKQGSDELAVWTGAAAGLQLQYTIVAYNVYNELSESFLAYKEDQSVWKSIYNDMQSYFKNLAGGTLSTLEANTGNLPINDYPEYNTASNQPDSPLSTKLAGFTGFYIGENYSNANPGVTADNGRIIEPAAGASRNEATTYAMVATKVTSNKVAKSVTLDANGNVAFDAEGNPVIVWGTPAHGERTDIDNGDLVILNISGMAWPLICESEIEANAIKEVLLQEILEEGGDGTSEYAYLPEDIKTYTYKDSYVHFLVWLNRDGFNDYNIGRNEFIHVHVTGVTGMDGNGNGIFPGYPGDPTDPRKPIDPTDETDENNPDPKDPEEEVEGGMAKLKVTINIKDWKYRLNGGVLSK